MNYFTNIFTNHLQNIYIYIYIYKSVILLLIISEKKNNVSDGPIKTNKYLLHQ